MYTNIVITGASNGLGMALAKKYAAPGICLGLVGRHQGRLNETAAQCKAQGAKVETISLDIRDRDRLISWIEIFDQAHPLDLIIANAGIMHAPAPRSPVEQKLVINEIFDINFNAVIDTINPILDRMASRGRGTAAIMSSLSAYRGIPTFPAYSASKAAIKTYYEAVRGLYRRQGVSISIICPSYVQTDMTETLAIPRLMLTGLDSACNTIYRGLSSRRPLITFPWYHGLGIRLLGLLPERMGDWILLTFLAK